MSQIENGVITEALLGFEGHSLLTGWILIDFDGSGQGYGGYHLGAPSGNWCAVWVKGLLETFGVDEYNDLVGLNVRVKRDENFGPIVEIGHIFKDKWFNFSKLVGT